VKKYNKSSVFALTTAVALILSVSSIPANAVINELLVTAQKREQNLQDVPVAVSAFDEEFLKATGFSDIFDLQDYTPGMFLTQSQTATQTTIYLRGIGTSGNNAGLEPSVGVFVDGVFRSRSGAAIFDMPDLERVEVLRGPQGTLFGKNTTSGAINIVSKKPDYEAGGNV
jgi:iron complex outermembrane receptor protein